MNLDDAIPHLESAFAGMMQSSVSATILILMGAGLFLLFPKFFGPRWRFVFGVAVLARLLMPISPTSQMSIFNLWKTEVSSAAAPSAEVISLLPVSPPETAGYEISILPAPAPVIPGVDPVPLASSVVSESAPHSPPLEETTRSFNLSALLPVLWLAGTFLIFSWTLVRNFQLTSLLRRRGVPVADERLTRLLGQARKSLGVRRSIELVTMPHLTGAAVFGWLRPRLLIAEDFAGRFSDIEIRGIFLHELAHLRRHDIAWNWFAHLALAIHWFNPLVWFAVRRFRADREQLCDAMVLDRLSSRHRRAYGRTLIALVETVSGSSVNTPTTPALSPFLTRKSELKNRITMINRKNSPAPWILQAVAAVALALAGAVTFTSALADDENEKEERREGERERRVERDGERERPETRGRDGDREHAETRERRENHGEEGGRRGEERERDHDGRGHDGERGEREHRELDKESREFIGTINELKERIGDLAREGKRDQAHELEEKIHEMFRKHPEQAERFHAMQRNRENEGIHREMRELESALKEAMEAGNEEKARDIREHMEKIHHAVRRRDEGEHAERRIHHLRQAAENLEAAGLHDQARELAEQAEEIENELRHHHAEGRDENLARHAEHLEREVAELREIVADLREHIAKLEGKAEPQKGVEPKTKEAFSEWLKTKKLTFSGLSYVELTFESDRVLWEVGGTTRQHDYTVDSTRQVTIHGGEEFQIVISEDYQQGIFKSSKGEYFVTILQRD